MTTKMTGYKATDANMQCRGFQYELGKWYEHKGDLDLCKSGFHFCVHPSGPWSFYNEAGTRVFVVEAEDVLDTPYEAGADLKKVARRIRLVREIAFDGHSNTGDSNTGDRNTGDRNTGDRNTGHSNTGHSNTGHRNTGHRNTGHRNTGHSNTGDRNTGDRNTGDRNTGYGCATDRSPDFFSIVEPKVKSFGVQTKLTSEQYRLKYPTYYELCELLHQPGAIDFEQFKKFPGITKRKLKALHAKHLKGNAAK